MTCFRRAVFLVTACLVPLSICACQSDRANVQLDEPELTALLRLLMPKEIEIQRYLTKPVSFAGDGNADGLEVILAALDPYGLPVKAAGAFQFELHHMRMASADRLGDRSALPVREHNAGRCRGTRSRTQGCRRSARTDSVSVGAVLGAGVD